MASVKPYSVLGSCVTRDAADLGSRPLPRPVHYFSRTKIQSLVSTPTPLDGDDIGLTSPFQTRVVLEDHRKEALQVLAGIDHALVVDLIDERFKLLDSGSGLVTESLYLRQSVLPTRLSYRSVPEDGELAPGGPFSEAVHLLAKQLPAVPVVVHRAFWATTSSSGEELANAGLGRRTNEWLGRAYDVLLDVIPGAVAVTPGPEVTVADPEHRWGLAAFHYPPAYYDVLGEQLTEVLGR